MYWLPLLYNSIKHSLDSGSAQVQILLRDSRWWESLKMVPTGNKAKRLLSVNHTAKTIHHHYQRSSKWWFFIWQWLWWYKWRKLMADSDKDFTMPCKLSICHRHPKTNYFYVLHSIQKLLIINSLKHKLTSTIRQEN